MWRIVVGIFLSLLFHSCCPAFAAQPDKAGIDRQAVSALVDRAVAARMQEKHVAGAIVAVVTAEGSLLERAYGIADQGPDGKADPAASLFRIGSVSKTFTYVAAMQLAGRGLLDLEADANRYLPPALQIPGQKYPPVKVWHLMTHTAGFEDSSIGALVYARQAPIPPLAEYLATYRPRRVRPPGVHSVYSNYSASLLGAMVAHVSGELYESYVERHLFRPLGMHNTTCREPLPPSDPRAIDSRLAKALSAPFAYTNGGFVKMAQPRLALDAPAGACSSTAADMARFMRMLLNRGSLDDKEIIPRAHFARFTAVRFSEVAGGAEGGLAHGFYRLPYGDLLSLEHAGDVPHFHAKLSLLPDAGIGIFVAVNSDGGVSLTRDLPNLLFRRVAGSGPAVMEPAGRPRIEAEARYAGMYLSLRRNFSSVEKIAGILHSVRIERTPYGYLRMGGTLWEQAGPGVFAGVGNEAAGRKLHFVEDGNGRIVGVATAVQYWTRAGLLDDHRLFFSMLGATVVAALCALVGFWRRRRFAPGLRTRLHETGVRHGIMLGTTIALWAASLLILIVAVLELAGIIALGAPAAVAYPGPALRIAVFLGHLAAAGALLLTLFFTRYGGSPAGRPRAS
jgi:CubicO group peptidase (beta-lactamase class C family)